MKINLIKNELLSKLKFSIGDIFQVRNNNYVKYHGEIPLEYKESSDYILWYDSFNHYVLVNTLDSNLLFYGIESLSKDEIILEANTNLNDYKEDCKLPDKDTYGFRMTPLTVKRFLKKVKYENKNT